FGIGIIGRRHPHRGAAVLPVLLAVLPGLVAGLAGARDSEGAPCLLAGIEVGRVDPAADTEFATGRADDGEVADDERGERHRLAERRLRGLALPHNLAGRTIESEDAAIERDCNDLVFPQHDAALWYAAARDSAGPVPTAVARAR